MQFEKDANLYSALVQREGGEDVLYINYNGAPFFPSLAGSAKVMEMTIDSLIENSNVSRIVFVQDKNYNYDFQETNYLLEIASLYVYLLKQENILSHEKLISTQEIRNSTLSYFKSAEVAHDDSSQESFSSSSFEESDDNDDDDDDLDDNKII